MQVSIGDGLSCIWKEGVGYLYLNNLEEIREAGFSGFYTIDELNGNNKVIPSGKGVYMVLITDHKPDFLTNGTGGFFKDKDPNVSIETLQDKWVNKTVVIYIGKAECLKSRIKQYLSFGRGNKSPHWGGRLIWQVINSNKLIICWKETSLRDPRDYEIELISEFKKYYLKRPFANIND